MLCFRRVKHVAFMNRDLRSYGWSALGEITLIISGILIAWQIDSWHAGRKAPAAASTSC